jgi:predicted nucleic acid-binding protein
MYLLDTNVVSELRKATSGRADANVIAWAASVAVPMLFISSITILEIEIRILQIERRDHDQGLLLRGWLENMSSQLSMAGLSRSTQRQRAAVSPRMFLTEGRTGTQ